MSYEFVKSNFSSLTGQWKYLQSKSASNVIFSTPEWSSVYWQCFNEGYAELLGEIKDDNRSIGIAPLMTRNETAFFIGSVDICDYLDFIILQGYEQDFFKELLNCLTAHGVKKLDMAPLRADSSVMTILADMAKSAGHKVTTAQIDVSPYANLPGNWEDYLKSLETKQRHELRRKMRRLNEMGAVDYRVKNTASPENIEIFFKLFRESREDKAQFLSPQMENYFRLLLGSTAGADYLRLNMLDYNGKPIAATICFDYNDEMLLYNSGFDREYSWLSAGLVSKAMAIEDSIKLGRAKFDFLKGSEEYKYHLGGLDLPIYRCTIII
jgi:CelD/BcsL family acetyltransferase involved in cellulose biosynthesis